MLSPSNFRDIISGRRQDIVSRVLRAGFRVLEIPYSIAVHSRNNAYDNGKKTIHSVDVPVVCVGNLTLGGTGKTPMVHWLARWLVEQDRQPVIVSRGYGSQAGKLNDEAMELLRRLPEVAHVQNPDRFMAAKQAIAKHHARCIILDDGFQHRRLARDLDIVLLDATEPFGYDHLFPRGTLRESLDGLKRASVAVLSRADLITEQQRSEIEQRVRDYNPSIHWLEVTHRPKMLINTAGEQRPIETLFNKTLGAFCAIGNPAGFSHTLKSCQLKPNAIREFADHHRYDLKDYHSLDSWATEQQFDALVCTMKDLVKFETDSIKNVPLWAICIEIEILKGQELLEQSLIDLIR